MQLNEKMSFIRLPRFPISDYLKLLKLNREQLVTYFSENKEIYKLVKHENPELYKEIQSEVSEKNAIKLLKYYMRAACRAEPYKAFSSLSPINFSKKRESISRK